MFEREITNEFSIRGLSHIDHDLPNQDATLYLKLQSRNKTKYTLLAVMDGVSASKNAYEASNILKEKLGVLFKKYVEEEGDEPFSVDKMKELIQELFNQYIFYIVQREGTEQEYGTTLEVVVLVGKHTAYTLHAGDGLIALLFGDGQFSISSTQGHSGEEPGVVYPFMQKRKWEFHEYKNVVAAFVSTDGVYSELIPSQAIRNGYLYDSSLLLPMVDIRAHKSKKSMEGFQQSFAIGELSDQALFQACYRLLKKGVIKGIDEEQLREQFSICQPYKKFCHSRDDLSAVFWSDYKKLPPVYDVSKTIPNYYDLWMKEVEAESTVIDSF